MSFLFRLPEDICILVLTEWSHENDVVKLDSAFCNQNDRVFWLLSTFSHNYFALAGIYPNSGVRRWTLIKNIKLKAFRSRIIDDVVWELDKSRMDTLDLQEHCEHSNRDRITQLINSCTCLTDLSYCVDKLCTNMDANLKINPNILCKLEVIELDGDCNKMVSWLLNQFAKECTKLRRLALYAFPDNSMEVIFNLLQNNKDLERFYVFTTEQTMIKIDDDWLYALTRNKKCILTHVIIVMKRIDYHLTFQAIFDLISHCQLTLQYLSVRSYHTFSTVTYKSRANSNSENSKICKINNAIYKIKLALPIIEINGELLQLFSQVSNFTEISLNYVRPPTKHVIDTLSKCSGNTLTKFTADYVNEQEAIAAEEYMKVPHKFTKLTVCECRFPK